ncbi:protocadherin Fat 4-like [Saccostrea cucullata]|uniref:protocadherin Fat 4-like n=1 Tax=Saccostrea cuccullata TaxID=36930 RepID=UPI002ED2F17A
MEEHVLKILEMLNVVVLQVGRGLSVKHKLLVTLVAQILAKMEEHVPKLPEMLNVVVLQVGQVNSNPCAPNPCLNGGTCSSNSGSAVCTCTSGWTGSLCQTPDTGNGIFQCGFETGMCLQNHQFNTINFYRTQAFPGISSAPEGNYYTLATSNFQSQDTAWLLPEHYLPVASVRVEFDYTSTGNGELYFSYAQGVNPQYYTLFSTSGDNGIWKSASVTIPAGESTFFYFTGLVGGSSGSGAVAVDNIRVTEI